jgi:hypothetical protein
VITLNTNKGLVKIESWDEIELRPGFVRDLNPADHKLDSIIGRYIFKEKIRCGLSICHMPHAKGYIVTTTDGHETNIGKDCGKREFGVDFDTLSKKFDRDITQAENRERLWSFSFQLEELENRTAELRQSKKGADWVYKHTQPLVNHNRGCPGEVVRRISSMIKTRTNIISTQREATKQEIEDHEAIEKRTLPRPYYIDVPIAELAGVEALYPENDLRQILVKDLDTNIRQFREKDIDRLTFEQLNYWVKWVSSVEITMERAGVVVAQGHKLLSLVNLSPFLKVLTSQDDANHFRSYLRGLSED